MDRGHSRIGRRDCRLSEVTEFNESSLNFRALRGFPSGRAACTAVQKINQVFSEQRCQMPLSLAHILIAGDHALIADLCKELLESVAP
jgi:hypothetical protein